MKFLEVSGRQKNRLTRANHGNFELRSSWFRSFSPISHAVTEVYDVGISSLLLVGRVVTYYKAGQHSMPRFFSPCAYFFTELSLYSIPLFKSTGLFSSMCEHNMSPHVKVHERAYWLHIGHIGNDEVAGFHLHFHL
jgi:hypothetical protein